MAKFEVKVEELGLRTFGYDGRSHGTVVRLAGHWTIEGREVARFGQTYREICDKCTGTGFLPHYAGIEGGRCFACGASGVCSTFGTGSVTELARKLRNRAQAADRREAKRAAKFAARMAEMTAEHEAWKLAHAALLPAVEQYAAFILCEHPADGNGPCYREPCEERRYAAKEIYSPVLLNLAYEATWKALSEDETSQFVELIAKQELRDAARLAKAARTAEKKWLGAEGEKITVTGTLAKPFYSESTFGYRTTTSTLYKLTTADGDTVAWFRTGYHVFEAGETVTLTGTVKALKETEKYGKETQLTRCKLS